MSFAEDEWYYFEDELTQSINKIEQMSHQELWTVGKHKTSDGDILSFVDMDSNHIRNIIKKDNTWLVYPLRVELRIRRLELKLSLINPNNK